MITHKNLRMEKKIFNINKERNKLLIKEIKEIKKKVNFELF